MDVRSAVPEELADISKSFCFKEQRPRRTGFANGK